MGTEILHPQDCLLIERFRSVPSISSSDCRQTYGNPNPNPRSCRKPSPRPDPRKRERKKSPEPNLVMGQVTILKRGESLEFNKGHEFKGNNRKKTVSFDDRDLIFSGTRRLGPEPVLVTKQIRLTDLKTVASLQSDVYAGSAFSQSPSPSSLPLPTFSRKKEGLAIVDDSATKDLIRLLRIG